MDDVVLRLEQEIERFLIRLRLRDGFETHDAWRHAERAAWRRRRRRGLSSGLEVLVEALVAACSRPSIRTRAGRHDEARASIGRVFTKPSLVHRTEGIATADLNSRRPRPCTTNCVPDNPFRNRLSARLGRLGAC